MIAKLTLRSLAAHRLRLCLTVLAVLLGVGFVSGAMIFSATLGQAFDSLYTTAGAGSDAVVRQRNAFSAGEGHGAAGTPIPASVLQAVEAVDGVAKAHGSIEGYAAVVDKEGKVVSSGQNAPQVGVDWIDDPDFSAMRLTAGHGPRTAGQVAIDAGTAAKTGYRVGDEVRVVLRGPSRTFTLTGIFTFGGSASLGGLTMTAFEPAAAQRLLMEQPGTYSRIAVHAADGVSQRQVRDAVARALPSRFEAVTGRQASSEAAGDMESTLSIFNRLLLIFSLVAVFVGSFIIANTFSMLVAQRTRELALLRALGGSRGQVTRSVLGEALGVGLAGSTLGLAAGAGLARGLFELVDALGADVPSLGLVLSGGTVAAAYTLGTAVTLAAAYLPARRAARIPPVVALRDDDGALPAQSLRFRAVAGTAATAAGSIAMAVGLAASGTAAPRLVAAGAPLVFLGTMTLSPVVSRPVIGVLGWPLARLSGATGRLSVRNAQRNPRRTSATAGALVVGLALTGAVTVMAASTKASIDRQLDDGLGSDYTVSSTSGTSFSPQAVDAVARTPGVVSAVASRSAPVELDGTVGTAVAGDAPALVASYGLQLEEGSGRLDADELLINRSTATSNGWQVGQAVPGRYPDGAEVTFGVAGIYTDRLDGPVTVLGLASYRAHYPSELVSRLDVRVVPGTDAAAVKPALRSALRPWPGLDLRDQTDMKAAARATIDEFFSFILVLLLLSVLIAALGIMNTLALAVVERTREIGLLRAVGAGRGQLRRMIRYEAMVISVFGALLGLGLGVFFGWALQRATVGQGAGDMEVLSVPFAQLGLYVLAAAVIGVLAAAWPARRAARMNILRAMATR